MKKYWLFFMSSLVLATMSYTLYNRSQKESDRQIPVALDSLVPDTKTLLAAAKPVVESGKAPVSRVLRKLYTKVKIDTLKLPSINKQLISALSSHNIFLRHAQDAEFTDLTIEPEQLQDVIDIFKSAKSSADLSSALDAYQVCGDGKGNIQFTGYYSPIIPVRTKPEGEFEFPVYLKNDKNADDLKVVFVRNREEVRSMKVEGTTYLQYPDGKKQMVTFNNDFHTVEVTKESSHDLTNVEEHKKAKATFAVFNEKEKAQAIGAGTVPLTTDYSIAVDNKYIPLGSVLLAEVPILDTKGNLVRHEYRFVLAQDVGGRIKGVAHVDMYMGEGEEGHRKMQHMNKYGKLLLLLPKEKEGKKLIASK